jgi:hypothetical protein
VFQVFYVRKKLEQHVKLVHGVVLPPALVRNPRTKVLQTVKQSAVLGIRDIMVWIRILRNVPLTNGSGSGSDSFLQ